MEQRRPGQEGQDAVHHEMDGFVEQERVIDELTDALQPAQVCKHKERGQSQRVSQRDEGHTLVIGRKWDRVKGRQRQESASRGFGVSSTRLSSPKSAERSEMRDFTGSG